MLNVPYIEVTCSKSWTLWDFFHFMQDECLLEPEIYERAEKLFRGLLHYVTELLVWEENSELSAELQPRYSLSDHMQMHLFICKALKLNFDHVFIHAGQKTMHTTVYCTTMSTTRTTMWSTPCSALLTVMRLKHRHTQHLLIKRYFYFYLLLTLFLKKKNYFIMSCFHDFIHDIHCRLLHC